MSFGFGIGDFLAVGTLALNIYKQCQRCSGQYRELSSDAGQLALTLSTLEDLLNEGRLSATERSQLLEHGKACRQVLLDMQEVLQKYESLSTKSKRIHDMLGWEYEGARDLRDRLTATVVMLSAFHNSITTSALFRLETAMTSLMRQIKQGQRSADSVSILSSVSADSVVTPAAWQQVISDFEDFGISADDVNKHRQYITQWIVAHQDTAAVDDAPSTAPDTVTDAADITGSTIVVNTGSTLVAAQQRSSEEEDVAPTLKKKVENNPRAPFSVSLEDLCAYEQSMCPEIVRRCIMAVEKQGLRSKGIYCATGSLARLAKLRFRTVADFHDSKPTDAWTTYLFEHDVLTVGSLLKSFLRELPQGLLTPDLGEAAARCDQDVLRHFEVVTLINSLSDVRYTTLRYVILHLARVVRHSDENLMDARNLSILFVPVIFDNSMLFSGFNVYPSISLGRVIETMINGADLLFSKDCEQLSSD